jgi:predicted PurR-regulated permease PerM
MIAIAATGFALYFAREFCQPIAIAVVLAVLFRAPVRGLEKLRVPTTLAAAMVVLALIAALFVIGLSLSGPVQRWFQQAPESFAVAQEKVSRLRKPLERVTDVIEKATQTSTPSTQPASAPAPQAPGYLAAFFGTTTTFLAGTAEVFLLLYLLLATGDLFLQKLIKMAHSGRDKANVRQTVAEVETAVLRFLLVMSAINCTQAIVVTLVMHFLHVPKPLLWGVFTFVLEFIPYLGATVMICLLAVTALTTFDSVPHVIAVPAAYMIIALIQSSVVSPLAYGQRLRLNPVAVLLGVLMWWFLWGVPGAFVAVPILATVKIVCDRTENLKPVGEFLGE